MDRSSTAASYSAGLRIAVRAHSGVSKARNPVLMQHAYVHSVSTRCRPYLPAPPPCPPPKSSSQAARLRVNANKDMEVMHQSTDPRSALNAAPRRPASLICVPAPAAPGASSLMSLCYTAFASAKLFCAPAHTARVACVSRSHTHTHSGGQGSTDAVLNFHALACRSMGAASVPPMFPTLTTCQFLPAASAAALQHAGKTGRVEASA